MLKWASWVTGRAEEYPRGFFAVCLLTIIAVCLIMLAMGSFSDPLPQFQLGAQEILQTHRITWNFLPVGYATLLGWAYVAGSRWGLEGMHACAMLLNTAILLLTFVTLRALLREVSSTRFATSVALLLTLYPELLQDIKKISDTTITLLTMLLILLAMVRLRRRPDAARAATVGAALAAAVLVRSNLALMPVLLLWALWSVNWSRRIALGAVTLASAAALYCLVTTAVHGKPFFPQNGDYNLYAGANAHTKAALLKIYNAESSIRIDMQAHGIPVELNWFRPANLPGIHDIRDKVYRPYYREQARSFIREHPAQMLELSLWKLVTFLRPETKRYHYSDPHKSRSAILWLGVKTLEAFFVPCWIAMLLWSWRGKFGLESALIVLMAVLYVLPFVLVNSDPRFRIPLDLLLAADMARMIYARHCQRQGFAAPCVQHPGW